MAENDSDPLVPVENTAPLLLSVKASVALLGEHRPVVAAPFSVTLPATPVAFTSKVCPETGVVPTVKAELTPTAPSGSCDGLRLAPALQSGRKRRHRTILCVDRLTITTPIGVRGEVVLPALLVLLADERSGRVK